MHAKKVFFAAWMLLLDYFNMTGVIIHVLCLTEKQVKNKNRRTYLLSMGDSHVLSMSPDLVSALLGSQWTG